MEPEELVPIQPTALEIALPFVGIVIGLVVAVASYRRSRHLSGHPVATSVVIGAVAGAFWLVWLVFSWVNRERIAELWRQARASPA